MDLSEYQKEIDELVKESFLCPLCSRSLDVESVGCFGVKRCPINHYEYRGNGNYASTVIINGKEKYYIDDMNDDSKALEDRIIAWKAANQNDGK